MATDSSSSVNPTILIMLIESIQNLINSMTTNGAGEGNQNANSDTSGYEQLLRELRDSLNNLRQQQDSNTQNIKEALQENQNNSKIDENSLSSAISSAFDNIYSPGEASLLSEEKAQTTLLQDIANQEKTNSSILDHMREFTNRARGALSSANRQLSTGELDTSVFGRMTNAISQNIDMYRAMVANGQDFGGSIISMRNVMNQSGLTLEQFSTSIQSGTQGLRMLGVQGFSQFAASTNKAALALGDLGMSGDRLNEFMGTYLDNLRAQGRLGTLNNNQLTESMRDFATQAAQLAHTMGISQNEAARRMTQQAQNPMLQVLSRGLSERQNNLLQQIGGAFSGNDATQRLFQSAVFSARTGAGVGDISVARNLAATGNQGNYNELVRTLRQLLNNRNLSDSQSADIRRQLYAVTSRIGNAPINSGIISGAQYGIGSTGEAFNFIGGIRANNFGQAARNISNEPTQGTLSGTDNLTRSLSRTDHLQQQLVNSYESLLTKVIDVNQQFLSKIVDINNNILNAASHLLDRSSTGLANLSGHLTSPTMPLLNAAANHPLITAGLLYAGPTLMNRTFLRGARSLLGGIRNLIPSGIGGVRTAGEGSAGAVTRGIASIPSAISRIIPSAIRTGVGSIMETFASRAGGMMLASRIAPLATAGMAAGSLAAIGGGAYVGGKITGTDYSSILRSHTNGETAQQSYDLDRNRWKSYASIGGGLLGGGIGTVFGAVPGALVGSMVGSTTLSYGAGKLYDWTHQSPITPRQTNILPQTQQQNATQQDTSQTQNPLNNPNINTQQRENNLDNLIKNLNDTMANNGNISNKNNADILKKLEDLIRAVKNNSNNIN